MSTIVIGGQPRMRTIERGEERTTTTTSVDEGQTESMKLIVGGTHTLNTNLITIGGALMSQEVHLVKEIVITMEGTVGIDTILLTVRPLSADIWMAMQGMEINPTDLERSSRIADLVLGTGTRHTQTVELDFMEEIGPTQQARKSFQEVDLTNMAITNR